MKRPEWLPANREFWFWSLAPWPAVSAGLYLFHSALLAFALYAGVCLLGARQLGSLKFSLRTRLSWKVHLAVAVVANIALVSGYVFLGKWLMPVERMRESLASVGVTRASFWWLFPYFLIGNPLVEEKFWRGGISLRLFGGFPLGSAISGIFFGAWHSLPVFLFMPAWSASLTVLGIIMVGIGLAEVASDLFEAKTERTRGGYLGDAVLLHALAADLPLLLILWIAL